jgi:hypothetical protein
MRTFVELLIAIYTESPLGFGIADICSADSPQSTALAAAFYIVMAVARTEDGVNIVRKITVVLPPIQVSTSITEDAIRTAIREAAQKHLGRSVTPEEQADVDQHLSFVRPDDLTSSAALRALEAVGARDAAIILHSASYRRNFVHRRASHLSSPILAEDQWVSHLVDLATQVVAYAKRAGCYVLLDTGVEPAT